jgi:glycosyltransferase involved in cell wall biosynthesis
MSNKLILSVTIPTYNPNADYIIQTIESVLNGGFDSKTMELLVVDKCSNKINILEIGKNYSCPNNLKIKTS